MSSLKSQQLYPINFAVFGFFEGCPMRADLSNASWVPIGSVYQTVDNEEQASV